MRESKKIADLSKLIASLSKKEGTQRSALLAAEKSEASHARQQRAREDRRLAEIQRSEDRRRQQERLSDERRRRNDLAVAAQLIEASETRLTERLEAIRPPRKEQLRLHYATASTQGDLRVDEEIRRVKTTVKASTNRDQVVIEHLPAATAGDLLDGLTAFRPHVVHFSGHANESLLVFDDGSDFRGPGNRVSTRAFTSAVEAPDDPPVLVVLNACRSAAQLMDLIGRVPMAVGMADSIGDADALTFATRFYRSLAEGQSVSASLAIARADLDMNGLSDHELPVLVTLPEIDPTNMRLVIA